MDWKQEALMSFQAVVAALLGGFVGWEREWHGREAGIRTYGAVSLGACVFALLSTHITTGNNPHVIAAGVVTGIGFLGGGVILRDQGNVVGLTTAATLWSTASIGLATGYGMYALSVLVALITFGLLTMHHVPGWGRLKRRNSPVPPEHGALSSQTTSDRKTH
ncbi:MAG: MgtC/SapB family protein [Pirellulales bacterium]|nr:MgtC/SapB family protein [Pirellulales bacterium]